MHPILGCAEWDTRSPPTRTGIKYTRFLACTKKDIMILFVAAVWAQCYPAASLQRKQSSLERAFYKRQRKTCVCPDHTSYFRSHRNNIRISSGAHIPPPCLARSHLVNKHCRPLSHPPPPRAARPTTSDEYTLVEYCTRKEIYMYIFVHIKCCGVKRK